MQDLHSTSLLEGFLQVLCGLASLFQFVPKLLGINGDVQPPFIKIGLVLSIEQVFAYIYLLANGFLFAACASMPGMPQEG
jgi:hypothetical protein